MLDVRWLVSPESHMRDDERNDLTTFVSLLDEFEPSACRFADAPDLLIHAPGATIGVEHTRLYREDASLPSGRQLRPQERIQGEIVERARESFRGRAGDSLYVTVKFSEPSDLRVKDVAKISDQLAEAVLHSLLIAGRRGRYEQTFTVGSWHFRRRKAPFPPGVDYFMLKITEPRFELWGPAYGYTVPHLTVGDISATIDSKESRLPTYLSRCASAWLLMVTDAGMPSSHAKVPIEVREHRYTSAFARVFLMSLFTQQLVELILSADSQVGTPPN